MYLADGGWVSSVKANAGGGGGGGGEAGGKEGAYAAVCTI